jgi:hypothetical protein
MKLELELIRYSPLELERLAQGIFRERVDVRFEPPIDLELLVEGNDADTHLEIKDGLLARGIEGCVLKTANTRDKFVWVDYHIYRGPWPEYNSVLGEEYAHLQIHKSLLLLVRSIEDFLELQGHPLWEHYERDARRFSRMIRMPLELVVGVAQSHYPRIVQEFGFADPVVIQLHIRSAIASLFEVSPADAHRRMLDASCNLEWRILASAQVGSNVLLPTGTVISSRPVQRTMFSAAD